MFDARSVLLLLSESIEDALGQLTKESWTCQRAVPRIDGTMYFDLRYRQDSARLNWIAPGKFLWSKGKKNSITHQVLEHADVLEDLMSKPEFSLLAYENQDLKILRFDEQLADTLLSGRFAPGRTRWFAYVFQEAFQPSMERFTISFEGPQGPVVLEICAASATSDGDKVYACELYNISIIEDSRDHVQRKLLPHQVERFVGFCMARSVNPSMSLQVDVGMSPGLDDDDNEPVSTTRWGNPKQWYQFFSDFEIERSSLCSIQFTDSIAYVVHGELECKSIEPFTFAPLVSYASEPWPRGSVEHPPGSRSFFTGIDERDAVFGASHKLEKALDEATRDSSVCMVCLNNTCLPKIIGDDVDSVVHRTQKKTSVPIVTMNTDLHTPYETYQDMVRQARESVENVLGNQHTKSGLALVGFPAGLGRRQLMQELGSCGIKINTCLIPEFGIGKLKEFLSTKAAMVFPYAPWEKLSEQVLTPLHVPLKSIPSPYGLSGFRKLVSLAAVACKLEEKEAMERAEGLLAPAQEKWNECSKKAKEHRLAFVLDMKQTYRLLDPRNFYGISMIPLLEEMGFGINVLLRTDSNTKEKISELKQLCVRPDTLSVQTFSSKEELEVSLTSDEFSAVYSEVFYDSRLVRSAKARFDSSMFEMGIAGALRSQKRLVRLCQWPFYRRYAKAFSTGVAC